jgi:beta-N-acetylglucosaminidase/uncharacterized coiled-coil DUF342 family protein
MVKLSVEIDELTTLIREAKGTLTDVTDSYNRGSRSLGLLSGRSSISSEIQAQYQRVQEKLNKMTNTLQVTYTALGELQSQADPSSGFIKGLKAIASGIKQFFEPAIKTVNKSKDVIEGIWHRLVGESEESLLEKMKENARAAKDAATALEFVDANLSSIQIREHLKKQHKDLYQFMLNLAKAYEEGGQAALDKELARLKTASPDDYKKFGQYAGYARFFLEDTKDPLEKLSAYEARIKRLQSEWKQLGNDSSLTAAELKEKRDALHQNAEQLREEMDKISPNASTVYELADRLKNGDKADAQKTLKKLSKAEPALAYLLEELGRTQQAIDVYEGYKNKDIGKSNIAKAEAYKTDIWKTIAVAFPIAAAAMTSDMNYKPCYSGANPANGAADKPTPVPTQPPTPVKPVDKGLADVPEAYRKEIEKIMKEHPNWNFEFYDAGMTVEQMINTQYAAPKSLTDLKKYYDPTDTKVYEGSTWRKASKEGLEAMIDPVNTFDDIYQYLQLSFSPNETVEGVKSILKGTVLEQYAQAFYDASKKYGVNSYYLAAKAMVESNQGKSTLAKGVMVDGTKVYNFHGIGANTGSAVSAGSRYAADHGWTTPELAIEGAAKFSQGSYIARGQDTLYTFRYNISGYVDGTDKKMDHQYAANIAMPYIEARHISEAFSENGDVPLTFKIPVYR